MRRQLLLILLAILALLLSACRFVVVESGSVRIEAPTPMPTVTLTDLE